MTDDQIKVVDIFFKMSMQFLLVIVAIGIWIAVTFALIYNPKWPMASVEGLLLLTLGCIYKYFFAPKLEK